MMEGFDWSQVPVTLAQFLTFLGTAGCIGAMLSWVASNWKFFQARSGQGKMAILFLISLIMGFASHFAVQYLPAGIVADAEPYYKIVLNTAAILLANQTYYNKVGKPLEIAKQASG
jgi:hypothetical protein